MFLGKAVHQVPISLQSRLTPPHTTSSLMRLVHDGVSVTKAIVAHLVDDREGGGATETVDFSYRGVRYQVDLTAADAKAMDQALAPYVGVARRVDPTPRPAPRRTAARVPNDAPAARDVRAWAVAEGITISERGRVSAEVVRRYQEAHTKPALSS